MLNICFGIKVLLVSGVLGNNEECGSGWYVVVLGNMRCCEYIGI